MPTPQLGYGSLGGPSLRQTQREQEIVAQTMREFSELQTYRYTFGSHWEETAQLILPTSRNTFFFGNYNWQGIKKTDRQVDATGMMALQRFAAILDSLLTPRNMMWHALEADNSYVMKDRATRLWFQDTTRRLFKARYAPIANFTSQNYQVYQSLGAFGNGNMLVDQAVDANNVPQRELRYKAVPLGEMFYHENHQGLVDGFIRWFRLTPRQAFQRWGNKCPEAILSAYEKGAEFPYDFLHRVCPNSEYDPDRLDHARHRFASYYVSIDGRALLEEGGYSTFPVAVTRYDQTPGEVYGRGPAQLVLPTLKTLNAEKSVFLKQAHLAADPALITPDNGLVGFKNRPGALNKGGMTSDGKKLIDMVPHGDIQVSKEMMDEERGLINDAFLVSLFQILTETPQMTATEVVERVNEKGILLAPTVGRQQSEYLGPMIDRELDLMSQMGMLLPMPPRLREARGSYHVVYTSPLSKQQRAQEVAGFLRTLESVKDLVNITQDPTLLFPFNFNKAIPDIARIGATPEDWLASDDEVAAKTKAHSQQMANQQQIQAMPAQAAMLKAHATMAKAGMPMPGQPGQQQPQGQ